MAYDEKLANRIREQLESLKDVSEKEMMGGLAFMVNGKMCVGIIGDEMMCRIHPDLHASATEKTGCREMDFTGRPMKGWVMVADEGMHKLRDLQYWIQLSLEYNKISKASPRKKKK